MEFCVTTCVICNQEHTLTVKNRDHFSKRLCALCKHEIKRTNQFLAQLQRSSAFLLSTALTTESAIKKESGEQTDGPSFCLWIDSDKIILGPESLGASQCNVNNYSLCEEYSPPIEIKIEDCSVKEEASNEDSCNDGNMLSSHNFISDGTQMEIYINRTENTEEIPPEDFQGTSMAKLDLLPEKSGPLYQKTYSEFVTWCQKKGAPLYTEKVLLEYFSELAQAGIIGSLWPKYSMLKATLQLHHNIDISRFSNLITFIKGKLEGHKTKKSRVLEREHIRKFLTEAPNDLFLMIKVALIFGVAGALRKNELLNLETTDVQDMKSKFLITIKSSKQKTNRIFTIVDDDTKSLSSLIREYISLRPKHTSHKRFFIYYKNNRCSTQPVGINTFSKLPSKIASFLNLDHPNLYTGHCFRRSSPSILSDVGRDFVAIERLGG